MITSAKQISPLLPLENGVQAKPVLCDRYHNITRQSRGEIFMVKKADLGSKRLD